MYTVGGMDELGSALLAPTRSGVDGAGARVGVGVGGRLPRAESTLSFLSARGDGRRLIDGHRSG